MRSSEPAGTCDHHDTGSIRQSVICTCCGGRRTSNILQLGCVCRVTTGGKNGILRVLGKGSDKSEAYTPVCSTGVGGVLKSGSGEGERKRSNMVRWGVIDGSK